MKNIHVLPTDKPSVLYKRNDLKTYHLGDFDICNPDDKLRTNQNIYITSNEEIKEGDWCLYLGLSMTSFKVIEIESDKLFYGSRESFNKSLCKKIILTTDQYLIKDGVQPISDEFLEWFVKNPSCEFVKIYYRCDKSDCYLKEWNNCCKEAKPVLTLFAENESKAKYFREQEIIIPKEEPKQETFINDTDSHSWGFENFEVIKTEEDVKIFVETMENIPEPNDKLKKAFKDFNKQETFEDKFQSWNELIKEVGSEEELLRILKLPHIAPLVREAMRSNCKNK